jgi:hypothetical protein
VVEFDSFTLVEPSLPDDGGAGTIDGRLRGLTRTAEDYSASAPLPAIDKRDVVAVARRAKDSFLVGEEERMGDLAYALAAEVADHVEARLAIGDCEGAFVLVLRSGREPPHPAVGLGADHDSRLTKRA